MGYVMETELPMALIFSVKSNCKKPFKNFRERVKSPIERVDEEAAVHIVLH